MLIIQIVGKRKKRLMIMMTESLGRLIPGLASAIKLHHIFDCTQRIYTSQRAQLQWKAANSLSNGP